MQDQFGRTIDYLRLSVTDLCNLRCRYCMPAEGICKKNHEEMLTEEEMFLAAKAAVSLGVKKIRITGGEPLVKKNIRSICERIGALSGLQELCLTTNGILLPELAEDLKAAGVSRINLSLDSLREDTYAEITRGGSLKQALLGLETALSAGFEKVKINMVLLGGRNDEEIPEFAALTKTLPVDVRFIEWMPMYRGGGLSESTAYSCQQALGEIQDREGELLPQEDDGGVAKLYRIPGAFGNIGLITPVSAHFCKDCRRIRISADGKLKPCLHSSQEISLKGLSYEEMRERMEEAILQKPENHGTLSAESPSQAGRSMNQIGG